MDDTDPGAEGYPQPDVHIDDPVMDGWPVFVDLPLDNGGVLPTDPPTDPGDDTAVPVGCWQGIWLSAGFSQVELEITGVLWVVDDVAVDALSPDVLLDDPVGQGDPDIVLDDFLVDVQSEILVPPVVPVDDPLPDESTDLPVLPPAVALKSIAEGRAQLQELMALAQQQSANPPDATLDDSAFLTGVSDEEGGYFCMTGCVTLMFVAEVPEATVELSLADWVF